MQDQNPSPYESRSPFHAPPARPRLRSRRDDRHAARQRAAVRRRRDRAARGRDRQRQPLSRRPVEEARRARPARHDREGGIRRQRPRLPGAHRGDGRGLARVGVGRPVVRRAFQSRRQPDAPQRQRGAEAKVPAQAGVGRARRRAGDERAERRLRRGEHEAARRCEGRPLRAERLEDVDHQRRRCRHADRLRKDRRERRLGRHHGVHRREGLQGPVVRQQARQARHARLEHLARSSSRTAKCRPRTCSARKAAASRC